MSAHPDPGPLLRPLTLARTSHPVESKAAARGAVLDGSVEKAQSATLAAVRATPGLTANELERTHTVIGRTFGRRLRELEVKHLVRRECNRRCRITGRTAACWFPA